MVHKMRKFRVSFVAFKGAKYAQESATEPIVEARDIGSAINKFNKMPYTNKFDVFKVEEVE